ncbi:hypothetical protein MHB42_05695 [Lysinibacillus sp. FSL K6-0232]|uniref:hypothetical protein n=1 Tax=unclassified Lysinibacillus TaxID=2636778 RepID=UPI0030F8B68F
MSDSKYLSESEITEILESRPRNIEGFVQKIEVTDRVALRESLEKTLEVFKLEENFNRIEFFNNVLNNFENTTFFIDFAEGNFMFYSFETVKNSTHYEIKDTGFFKLPK